MGKLTLRHRPTGDRPGQEAASGPRLPPQARRLLRLQGTAGNHAVQRFVQSVVHEREADQAADLALSNGGRDAFGWDFSSVRVHRDDEAAARLGAKAYTVGNDVYLGKHADERTIAHELAHVVQQDKANGTVRRSMGIAAELTAAPSPRQPMAVPTVTAVNVPAGAEIGVRGRAMDVTATAAGRAPLTWTLVGAPAGVTVTPRGRRGARISAGAAALGAAGGTFQVRAALTATPGDNAISGNVRLVAIQAVTVTPAPAFAAGIATAVGAQAPPANSIDPNRDGITGNTGTVNVIIVPAGRPVTVTLTTARGATVAGTTITPGATTGPAQVRVEDNATRARTEAAVVINPVPTAVASLTNAGGAGAGMFGQINNILFRPTHGASAALTRVVGETITAAGRDDFGILPVINGTGPNPVPNLGQSAPSNNWPDNVVTPQASINVNQFVGPGAPGLPAISDDRQGMHYLGWSGVPPWSNEFAHGIQRVMLIQRGANFIVRTEHHFGGVHAPPRDDPYPAAPNPLIRFTGITITPNAPVARGLAADGVATAAVTFASTTPARTVNLSLVSGSMAFTTPIAGAPVAGPHTLQAGLVAARGRIRIADATFANRRADGVVTISPVRLGSPRGPSTVATGVATATLDVAANPGGRTLIPTVDNPAFVAVMLPPAVPASPARQILVTRLAPGPASVRVTITDSVLGGVFVTKSIRFR